MKIWISGRIDADIDNHKFGDAMHFVEKSVNNAIVGKNYGDVESWDVIMIIFRDCSNDNERFKYNSRSRETNIEVCVNHDSFKNGDLQNGRNLFFDALLYSFDKMKDHKKLQSFDFENIITDVQSVKKEAAGK